MVRAFALRSPTSSPAPCGLSRTRAGVRSIPVGPDVGYMKLDKIQIMNILTEIHRNSGVNVHGKTIHRTAVRGVILRDRDLLMIHSTNVGDYKFPGGGVADGETHKQALCREVQEECGMRILYVGSAIGTVIEYDIPIEKDYDVFKMTSHYYRCDAESEFGTQKLDDYEQELGFEPIWISIADALLVNKALLHSDKSPQWLRREIFVLQYILHNIL
jgi:8-oxo-dGTP pyrophosphatase MutT (NUDIX family)